MMCTKKIKPDDNLYDICYIYVVNRISRFKNTIFVLSKQLPLYYFTYIYVHEYLLDLQKYA